MSILLNFLRSLVLTVILSFAAPVLLIGTLVTSLWLSSHISGFETISQAAGGQILKFLSVFGSGNPLEGVLVIGLTCGLVGAIFDAYAFYRYQNLRDS